MSKLVKILKATGISLGTGLSTYYGFELGGNLTPYLSHNYMIPEITQGLSAFLVGNVGNRLSRQILDKKGIDEFEAYSLVALNAFANTKNEDRNLSINDSLENISNNLVEVISENGKTQSLGSGLMITSNGYVITAHHVITNMIEKKGKTYIKMQSGKTYLVSKGDVHYNSSTDLAIIKAIKASAYVEPIKVKVSLDSKLKLGDEIRVLGFRDGQKYNTLGLVTNPNHTWKQEDGNLVYDLFQTDARGKQGQSGGVIVNSNGELVGITVYSSRKSGEEIGVIGGARISNILKYINQICAKKSGEMFI